MDDEGYTTDNTHRAFLQAFIARSTLTFEQAKPVLAAVLTADSPERPTLPNDITEVDFNQYVSTCNNAISPFDYEIRSTLSQHDRTRIFALVNTTSDAITQLATIHSADEISFLKRVLDAIFITYNKPRAEIMAVTSMQALKLHRAPAGNRAETVEGRLRRVGWFERSRKGFYSLAPRALMELRGWLLETYNEPRDDDEEDEDEETVDRIKLCQACKEIVTVGQRCANMDCPCRLHNFCTRNVFRVQNAETCPVCKTPWDDQHPVGEKAANVSGRRSTGGASRRTTIQTDGAADEVDRDQDQDEDEDEG
ncbi:hypothetical protein H2203_000858 [Taxawa tesnikishii (nom. ined.)]|nr:hypothetical protein H2203_000858 [Dothideales sp. JES 119]